MNFNRATVWPVFLVACYGQEPQGAKALFLDPTSSVTLQRSASSPVSAGPKKPPVSPATKTSSPESGEGLITGLRYWIEVQTDRGQLLRVTSSRIFKSGERMRLHFESNVDGSLVILQSQDSGPYAKLFPNSTASGRVEKFTDQVFPSKNGWFRFDSRPGDIRLMVMLQPHASGLPNSLQSHLSSRQAVVTASAPHPGATNLPNEPVQPPGDLEARMRAQMERLRGSKALVVEEDNSSAQPAGYAVLDRRNDPSLESSLITLEVKLAHR